MCSLFLSGKGGKGGEGEGRRPGPGGLPQAELPGARPAGQLPVLQGSR